MKNIRVPEQCNGLGRRQRWCSSANGLAKRLPQEAKAGKSQGEMEVCGKHRPKATNHIPHPGRQGRPYGLFMH